MPFSKQFWLQSARAWNQKMYSKKAFESLQAKNIVEGDCVRVSKKGNSFEGILLPHPEASGASPDALIIKLNSGYNVGIKLESGVTLEKLAGRKKIEVLPTVKITRNAKLPSVSLITTGGTVSSKVDYETGGVSMLMNPEEILANVPELARVANVTRVHSPFRIMSEDATYKEWQKIAVLAAKEVNSSDSHGVVIMHGTDTLHYTSAALSFMLRSLSKPVALVGAQRSPDRSSFDGAMNLACAAVYAASPIAETAVVMHESESDDYCTAIPGTKARKMHSSRRDAFKAINAEPLARISPDGGFYALVKEFARRSDGKTIAETGFEPRVAIIKAFPSSIPEIIDFYAGKKFRGLVIEGTGLGHVPTSTLDEKDSWLPAIKRAVDAGVVVAMVTQCVYGRVHPLVYANARLLNEAGVVYCSDMTSETAFVKLGWLLAKFKKAEDVKRELLVNYAREINPRITASG